MADTNIGKLKLDPTKAPVLPFGPVEYARQYQDQLNNLLRQYFQTNDNFNGALLDISGGRFLSFPSGSFISTTTQTAAVINTGYAITLSELNGTTNNNVFIGGATANSFPASKIYISYPGIYNLQFSLQLVNTDSQAHDVNIWVKKNDSNETNSNTILSVPSKHGSVDGHVVAAWNFFLEYPATTDYFELFWSTASTTVSIKDYAAVSPAPATPSVILTMQFVSRL